MAKMTLKIKVNDPHFQYQLKVSKDGHMFGANLVIPAQICDVLSCGQGKVYRQMAGQTQVTKIPLLPERPMGKRYKFKIKAISPQGTMS